MSDASQPPASGAGSGTGSAPPKPQVQARAIYDPGSPQAGTSGYIPPPETRFQPGQSGNPGGRPKGALPRTAFLHELARNEDERGIGAKAGEIGARYVVLVDELISARGARRDEIQSELAEMRHVFDQAEGKPQEHIDHSGGLTMKRVILDGDAA